MITIKRCPMPCNINKSDYNNNNLHEYDPYILSEDGKSVIIDKEWWKNNLTDHIRNLIHTRLQGLYTINKVDVPHPLQTDNDMKVLQKVYQSYIDGYDYNIWYPKITTNNNINKTLSGVHMIKISDEVKRCLLFDVNPDQELTDFERSIQQIIDTDNNNPNINNTNNSNKKYFVRLSSTSGKNEKAIRIFTNAHDIVRHLTSVKLFAYQEYQRTKDSYLILIPWNDKVLPRYEFRIFVVNNRLVAVSPQKWWELNQYTGDELELLESAFSNIDFIDSNQCPYQTFVSDVYVDTETSKVKLIEYNPFGAHSGAGSSFFNWITDYDLLHDTKAIEYAEFRYMSAINY